jgi:hypothetical protein
MNPRNDRTARPCMSDDTTVHADIAALLKDRPGRGAFLSERVTWLFRMAHALNRAGLTSEADTAMENAVKIVRRAIAEAAGGDPR